MKNWPDRSWVGEEAENLAKMFDSSDFQHFDMNPLKNSRNYRWSTYSEKVNLV